MNRRAFSALLAFAMCLLLLSGCAFFSKQDKNDPISPGQNTAGLAPEGNNAPQVEPDAGSEESPPLRADTETPDGSDPSAEPESDTPPEEVAPEPEGDNEPSDDEVTVPSDDPADNPDEQPTEPTYPISLSADELRTLEDWFNQFENNGLLRFPYADLTDPTILAPYLEILFYDVGENPISEEERALLAAMDMPMETDVFRLGRGYVTRYLLGKLDIDLENVDMEALSYISVPGCYLPQYDAWYICHGDVMYAAYTFTSGLRHEDGTVVITYTNNFLTVAAEEDFDYLSDVEMELTLRQTTRSWRVVSHKICE